MVLFYILIFTTFALYINTFIRNNSTPLYLSAVVLSAVSILFFDTSLNPIISGEIGVALLLIVMFQGVLKKGTNLQRKIRNIRREYAILGTILVAPHFYMSFYDSLFNQTPLDIIGLLTFISLIPLFITSFQLVRSKMLTSTWLSLHRSAYLSYFLMYLYILSFSNLDQVIGYSFIFGMYGILKLSQFFKKRALLKATVITIVLGTSSILLMSNTIDYLSKPYDIVEGNEFQDGTYIGYARGYHNIDTLVQVVIRDNEIQLILIDECGCTPFAEDGRFYDIAYSVARDIRTKNTTEIDSIAGATDTSDAITKAVRDALKHAIIE